MIIDLTRPHQRKFYEESLKATNAWVHDLGLMFSPDQQRDMVECFITVYQEVDESVRSGVDDAFAGVPDSNMVEIIDMSREVYDLQAHTKFPIGETAYREIVGEFFIEFITRRVMYNHGIKNNLEYYQNIRNEVAEGKHAYFFEYHFLSGRCDYELHQKTIS